MQTKNKINIIIFTLLGLLFLNLNLYADEFNITAKEVIIDKDKEIIIGIGSVKAVDAEGKIIYADKITYKKNKEFLLAEGNVIVEDIQENILTSNKASFDKINNIIISYDNTTVELNSSYTIKGSNISYNTKKKLLNSNQDSVFNDKEGNVVEASMFQYNLESNIFSSIGKIKVTDIKKNKYFFKEIHVDTKIKEMIGSDVSIILDQKNFGVSDENDPRFVANDITISKEFTKMSKGVFTVCKKKDEECPPWTIKAKKINHDKIKKTVYYDHATLKLYDIPLFYFPKFFHPDPSVKRQSGFLVPFFSNTTSLGTGFGVPYYWAMGEDKDLTFTPKAYKNDNLLILGEYRQAFKNASLILDAGFTEGYKDTNVTEKKTGGSRSHIFAELDFDFSKNDLYESELSFQTQRTSNSTYFRVHDVNTTLVSSEDTNLKNEVKYNFSKDDMFLSISVNAYEDIRNNTNSRYEFILPNILYGKTFFTEKFGTLDFTSNAYKNIYDTNKHKSFLTNDVIWSSSSNISKNGIINSLQAMVRNTNYETKRITEYKDSGMINEISAVLAHKSSLPMIKDGINYSNLFSPNVMFRYAPGHMRNLSGNNVSLNHTNLYSLNKTSEIEDGLSAILGFDFKVNKKLKNNTNKEKFSLSIGQIFNADKNTDIPSKSSLDQRMSDIVGDINYNFSEFGKIGYKFSLDHNFNDLNYNEFSTELNFGLVEFNLDYLEEQNHVGNENYITSGVTLNLSDHNQLSLSTKKNFKTESTELYDIAYQYKIDCLTASLAYRREFYQDSDVRQNDTLMFTLTFIPFGAINTPTLLP